jgi:hypothetical protein
MTTPMEEALTQQQTTQILETLRVLTQAVLARNTPIEPVSSQTTPSHKKYLDSRDFVGFTAFKGDEKEFTEFQHKLMCAIGISSEKAKDEVDKAAKADMADLYKAKLNEEQNKISIELYSRLCLLVEGEAHVIVRGGEEQNGLMAWQRLVKRYQPNTPLRRLQSLSKIFVIKQASNAVELGTMMEKWEMMVKSYTSQAGQEIDPKMRAAALLGMCPHDLLDTVANLMDPEDPIKLAGAMRMYVSNRAFCSVKEGHRADRGLRVLR